MGFSSGASGSRGNRVLIFFSLFLLLLGLFSLPTSALPKPSPSLTFYEYTVNTTTDDDDGSCDPLSTGDCTLREAITAANSDLGVNNILFDIANPGPGCDGVTCTITLTSDLPPISEPGRPITIDGTTQPDTNPYGPEIVVNGSSSYNCFTIRSAYNTIKGLVINQCVFGIRILSSDAHHNTISGNYIGTNAQGTAPLGNTQHGIVIIQAHDNTIGGTTADARNIISGNQYYGVLIMGSGADDNIVSSNYIGTSANGTSSVGNGFYGVHVWDGAQSNTIGLDNIIAYNGSGGVWVDGATATTTGNTVTQNSIHSNSGPGIDLTNGGNTELSPPTISSASCSSTYGTAPANATVELFTGPDDEGKTYLTTVSADGSGNWSASDSFAGDTYLTATATDAGGNTSQFSTAVDRGCYYIYLPLIMKNY